MSAPAPQFVRFVSSVEGRLVGRWDAPRTSFGARVTSLEERKHGAEPIVWDTEAVIPLQDAFVRKYDRELRGAIRRGDLLERKREDYNAYQRKLEEREAERTKAIEADKARKAELTVDPTSEVPGTVEQTDELPGEAEQVGGFAGDDQTPPVADAATSPESPKAKKGKK